jgi:hypothetical protein
MRRARHIDQPAHRRSRVFLLGTAAAALLVVAAVAFIAQRAIPDTGDASSSATSQAGPEKSLVPSSTIGTADEPVTRLHEIFRIRDQAIQTRNARILDDIYTIDCPCLKGDQTLIRNLRKEGLVWRGVKVSLDIKEVKQVNDRLWTVSAQVTTSSFDIRRESGGLVRRVPSGREHSRFALSRPVGEQDWMLGHASVIPESD